MLSNWRIRAAGLLLVFASAWFAPWMITHLNTDALWLSIPFVAANLLLITNLLLTLINNWTRSVPEIRLLGRAHKPLVAVVVPTCGEPVEMVMRTARSVLGQNWPLRRMVLVISDDARSEELARNVAALARHSRATVVYHQPLPRGSAERRGEAKAGNLNSALDMIRARFPEVAFIETRDADDEVVERNFLRHCVGQLLADPGVAYVQTVKEVRSAENDPFCNMDTFFYRGSMMARHAANAVFPCGSGLVWRLEALTDIGDFPSWNLVEDLQSGVEALKRGWRGAYLPIVGALAQHAPEDIPNVYKQRGTWALDTLRLIVWGKLRGLTLRQKLQFFELGLFYLQGLHLLSIGLCLAVSLGLGIFPLATTQMGYAIHFWPFVAAVELFLITLNGKQPFETLLRARQMWLGLTPVYLRAAWLALRGGPNHKPAYRITRKNNQVGWYLRETLVQWTMLLILCGTLVYGLLTQSVLSALDLGSVYWALLSIVVLGGFIRKSWYGVDWRSRLRARRPLTQRRKGAKIALNP